MKRDKFLKKPFNELYKSAWKYFSLAIRIKSDGRCFTCGRYHEINKLQAGHFVHGGNNKYSFWLDFNPININPQCFYCNHYLSGNSKVYAKRLIDIYGSSIIGELEALKWKQDEWSLEDLADIIEQSKEIIKKH